MYLLFIPMLLFPLPFLLSVSFIYLMVVIKQYGTSLICWYCFVLIHFVPLLFIDRGKTTPLFVLGFFLLLPATVVSWCQLPIQIATITSSNMFRAEKIFCICIHASKHWCRYIYIFSKADESKNDHLQPFFYWCQKVLSFNISSHDAWLSLLLLCCWLNGSVQTFISHIPSYPTPSSNYWL